MIRFYLAAAILIIGTAPASAELVEFDCMYPKSYDAFKNKLEEKETFRLQFKLDTVTNKAFLIGNNGVDEVTYFAGDQGITFLEFLKSGVVQTTTIAKTGASVHRAN
jgi:hypothetical protein